MAKTFTTIRLQLGRGWLAAETASTGRSAIPFTWLQLGRGWLAAETNFLRL